MIKAVRFDPIEHSKLIEYIDNYRDSKNKPNHSEAIRLLMSKGLENLQEHQDKKTELNSNVIEEIKKDLFEQIMQQLATSNNVITSHQNSQSNYQNKTSDYKEEIQQKEETFKKDVTKIKEKISELDNVNPLLANILGNAER